MYTVQQTFELIFLPKKILHPIYVLKPFPQGDLAFLNSFYFLKTLLLQSLTQLPFPDHVMGHFDSRYCPLSAVNLVLMILGPPPGCSGHLATLHLPVMTEKASSLSVWPCLLVRGSLLACSPVLFWRRLCLRGRRYGAMTFNQLKRP